MLNPCGWSPLGGFNRQFQQVSSSTKTDQCLYPCHLRPLCQYLSPMSCQHVTFDCLKHKESILSVCHSTSLQVPAVFDGLVAYKNGMKGAIATQVGLVQFENFRLADNGGGPLQHIVNGKDNGANMEMTWILDDRNRDAVDHTSPVPSMPLINMAGEWSACLSASAADGCEGPFVTSAHGLCVSA